MSIFEDPVEIYQDAPRRIDGPEEIETIECALKAVGAPADDVALVLGWDSVHTISDQLDVTVPVADHVVREHVELDTKRIGQALGTKTTVHGIETSGVCGIVMDPSAVRYDNSVVNPDRVVAIDFLGRQS